MFKKQLDLPKNCHKVTNSMQAKFHLDRGDALAIPITWNRTLFIMQGKSSDVETKYDLTVIPVFGKALCYEGTFNSIHKLMEVYDAMVLKGAFLEEREPTWFEKGLGFINELIFERGEKGEK